MNRWRRWARPAFHVVAAGEACSWLGLLAGMGAHYLGGASRAGIELFGPVHGAMFVAYVVVSLAAARLLRWSPRVAALALAASIPPLATVVLDRVATRRGWLGGARRHGPQPGRGAVTAP